MRVTKVYVAYLSGTGTTEKYVKAFADALDGALDIAYQTVPMRHDTQLKDQFNQDDLLVLAAPVFGGYVPAYLWEWISNVRGEQTPLVNLAVYGARDYDNALFEMNDNMKKKGFVTIGAAALVARHSIAQTIAANRPDAHDIKQIQDFSKIIAQRLESMADIQDAPAHQFKFEDKTAHVATYPLTKDTCTSCGTCAMECPSGAIPVDTPHTLESEKCISCLRCIEVCPEYARYLPSDLIDKVTAMLIQVGARSDKPNSFF